MLNLFLSTFVTLFVIIDPPGCAPIFAGLTRDATHKQAFRTALRATVIAGLILLMFATVGRNLLDAMHIEMDSFRIAGGLMLFLIALDMVFEKRTQRREERAEKIIHDHEPEDVSVFPMAMPMIAGPGSIAAVMLATSRAHNGADMGVMLAALVTVLLLNLAGLAAAKPIMRLLGSRVEAVITRVLGVLLGALAVQFVVDGIRGALA